MHKSCMELHQTACTGLEINLYGGIEIPPKPLTLTKEVKELDPGNPWDHLTPAQIPSLQAQVSPVFLVHAPATNTCKTLPRTRSRSTPKKHWITRQELKRRIKAAAEEEASLRAVSGPARAGLGHRARPAQLVHGSHLCSAPPRTAAEGRGLGAGSTNPS